MSLLCNSGKPLTTFTYSHWYCVFCATVPKQTVSDIPIVVPSVQLWQTILHLHIFPLILSLLCNLDKPSCTFSYSHWYCAFCATLTNHPALSYIPIDIVLSVNCFVIVTTLAAHVYYFVETNAWWVWILSRLSCISKFLNSDELELKTLE